MDTPKTKPDLLAAQPRSGSAKRILAALEHGGKPAPKPARASAWTIDSWTVALGLLLLLMLGAAWIMHDHTITPSSFKHSDSGDRRISATHRVEKTTALATEQPAAIVNESPAHANTAPAAMDAESTGQQYQPGASGAPLAADVTVAAAAAAAAGQNAAAHATQQVHKPAPAGASSATRAPQATSTQSAATATRGAAAAGPASGAGAGAGSAAAARDTDVTLLAALVAHANKPSVTVAERSRDVVERKDGDTTAQLLARCQQLGLIEGMLCRSRICSDRWDADAACRAPAH